MKPLAVLCLTAVLMPGQGAHPRLRTWSLEALRAGQDPSDAPMPVGSLQKPFVAKAWALSHPGQTPPSFTCGPGLACWLPSGHGELGLGKALSVSCNAYFRHLAADTPVHVLQDTLAQEGFQGTLLDAETAIGLPGDSPLMIRPSRLLAAFHRLVREPWTAGEAVRPVLLAGLRESPRSGTAASLGLGGCWAKTGTVPAGPQRTRGLVLVVEDAGGTTLAELSPGTGHDAAAALGRQMRQGLSNPGPGEASPVLVQLFDLLPAKKWRVRNLEAGPIPTRGGFLGPGAVLVPGDQDWVGPGLLEIELPGTGLVRRLRGRLSVGRDRHGQRQLIAALEPREYVAGVLCAELPGGDPERRLALGAAALRFLAKGPRHLGSDVCDSTHCAWFVGRGPRLNWATAQRATLAGEESCTAISDSDWRAMLENSRRPGPSQWSSDCGGAPLSPHALWGNGDRDCPPCPRHGPGRGQPWRRLWRAPDLAIAFGGPVLELAIQHPDGVWTLVIRTVQGIRELRFDEAHRVLARILGWDALPSPADVILPLPSGFQVEGVGKGHRVGLCLAD